MPFGRAETKTRSLHSDHAVDVASVSNFRHFRVTHYHLDLEFDFRRKEIKGTVDLRMTCLHTSPTIILDCHHCVRLDNVVSLTSGQLLPFEVHPFSSYGAALHIHHPSVEGDVFTIQVQFLSGSGPSLNWQEPEQTAGREKPFFYSVGFTTTNRTLFPCCDSPAVKATYTAFIKVPSGFTAVMSAAHREELDGNKFYFKMDHPISTYLIAIAVGELVSQEIGPRSRVWAEPCMLDKAFFEFSGAVERYIQLGEKLFGPYVWERYDILVMPPSFPFGGMENPCLTFVTPGILVGDRSLLDVIMHEVTHSWFGNLVTNASWSELWLNEGITMYGQRCISAELHGEAYTCIEAATGRALLKARIEGTGEFHPLNRLRVIVSKDVEPDNTYNEVPYEKGYCFASYLENMAGGRKNFTEFLKYYCKEFKYKSVLAEDLLDLYLEYFPHLKASNIQDREGFSFKRWLMESGWPPYLPDLSAGDVLMKPAQDLAAQWMEYGHKQRKHLPTTDISSWKCYQIVHFLDNFLSFDAIPQEVLAKLSITYPQISQTHNAEIMVRWAQLIVRHNYRDGFACVENFLKSQAKQKYSLPVYTAMWRGTEETRLMAVSSFRETQKYLHINVRKNIERILSS